ncbi:MAG TPA: hypothetical protein VFI95_03130, partial [Terriglobales bacterium]|nr:hypothetical protein [Terriglobales bacterium]
MISVRGSVFISLVVLTVTLTSTAQVATGFPAFGSFQRLTGPDVVNLGNLNLHVTIPVVHKAGVGMPFDYSLQYDNSIWSPVTQTVNGVTTTSWQFTNGWSAVDASVFGSMKYFVFAGIPGFAQCPQTTAWYTDPSGTVHPFPGTTISTESSCGPLQKTVTAADGSGYVLTLQGTDVSGETLPPKFISMLDKSGNSIVPPYPPSITDPNGNSISEVTPSTGGFSFTDTLGANVLTVSIPGSNPVKYSYPGPGGAGALETVSVNYSTYTVATKFACSGISEYPATSQNLISSIQLPDGTQYTLKYEPTPLMANAVTGRLREIDLPTGGQITYSYSGGNKGINCSDGSTATLTRTEIPGGIWIYSHSPAPSGSAISHTNLVNADNNETDYTFSGIYETQRLLFHGNGTSKTLLRTVNTCYNNQSPPTSPSGNNSCPTAAVTPPITQKSVYMWMGAFGALPSNASSTTYDSVGDVTQVVDYDWWNGSAYPQLRRLDTPRGTWNGTQCVNPIGNNILDRVCYQNLFGTSALESSEVFVYYANGNLKSHSISPSANVGNPGNLTTSFTYNANGTVA